MQQGPRKKEVEEGTEQDCIVLGADEDDEGMGRVAEQGGDVHPSGGTATLPASAAPTPEVQHAIQHAYDVSEGRANPTKTTIIAPDPTLLSPPPQLASSLSGQAHSGP